MPHLVPVVTVMVNGEPEGTVQRTSWTTIPNRRILTVLSIETHPSRYDCSESLASSSLRLSLLVIAPNSPNRAGVHETDSTCPSSRYKVRPASFSNRFPGKCCSPQESIAPLTTRQESRRVLPVNPSLVTRPSSALFDHQSLMTSPHYICDIYPGGGSEQAPPSAGAYVRNTS